MGFLSNMKTNMKIKHKPVKKIIKKCKCKN